ncbi:MAG: type II/IV secretion system protein [Deltaproteobacteria bacterium]|nr:type II/IV secretion system protein [Deltaproteobacteria bacterium]
MHALQRLLGRLFWLAVVVGILAWWVYYRPGTFADGLSGALNLARDAAQKPLVWGGGGIWALGTVAALGLRRILARVAAKTVAAQEAVAQAAEASAGLRDRLLALTVRLKRHLGPPPDLIELVDQVVYGGLALGASDIHVEPVTDGVQISYRLHGLITPVLTLATELHRPILNRLKVLTRLVSFVSDRPQDGRFLGLGPRGTADVRVSILPTNHGEKAVLRLAAATGELPGFASLGISSAAATRLQRALDHPQGLIYVTGPTGSGKTRTIYAALGHIKSRRGQAVHLASIEDPIESDLPFLTQTQVQPDVGLSFAAGLRSILRQDPNVMLVGEIRDPETARIAVQAGLSGHLILTTIHAESAAGVFNRLIDMQIEPFLVASASVASVAQRLVRALCPDCRVPTEPTADEAARLEQLGARDLGRVYKPIGCPRCDGQGYVGRRPLVEILEVDPSIRDLIISKVPTGRIHEAAVQGGMPPLLEDGLGCAIAGITSLREVLRVVG